MGIHIGPYSFRPIFISQCLSCSSTWGQFLQRKFGPRGNIWCLGVNSATRSEHTLTVKKNGGVNVGSSFVPWGGLMSPLRVKLRTGPGAAQLSSELKKSDAVLCADFLPDVDRRATQVDFNGQSHRTESGLGNPTVAGERRGQSYDLGIHKYDAGVVVG
jgi:hypothetical protein